MNTIAAKELIKNISQKAFKKHREEQKIEEYKPLKESIRKIVIKN